MSVKTTILGSGSKGNAAVIQNNGTGILIDAGFNAWELLRRMNENNIDPDCLQGVVVTHEHGDHVLGVREISNYLQIPVFTNENTYRQLKLKNLIDENVVLFNNAQPFDIFEMSITAFSIAHDTVDPVGFVVEIDGVKTGIATDLGHISDSVAGYLRDCSVLILESNYDYGMLMRSGRPTWLIERINGSHGHLDNIDALYALEFLLTVNTRHLVMAHVSQECNDYAMVEDLVSNRLAYIDRGDIVLQVARQDQSVKVGY